MKKLLAAFLLPFSLALSASGLTDNQALNLLAGTAKLTDNAALNLLAANMNTIKLRNDTAANWTAANPVLAKGEMGVELAASPTASPKIKVGDGVTAWISLLYAAMTPAQVQAAIDAAVFTAAGYSNASDTEAVNATSTVKVMVPRTSALVLDRRNLSHPALARTWIKGAALAGGSFAQIRYLALGDSMGIGVAQYQAAELIAKYGCVGFYSTIGGSIAGSLYTAGGATYHNNTVDYSITPLDDYVILSASGHAGGVSFDRVPNNNPYNVGLNGVQVGCTYPRADTIKICYVKGGGHIKVQYSSNDRVTWTDVASLTDVDTSAGTGLGWASGAITETQVTDVRGLWISGTTYVFGGGCESSTRSGVVIEGFHKGGTDLKPFATGNGTAALLSVLAPDLVTICSADGTTQAQPYDSGAIVDGLNSVHALLAALASPPDEIYIGINQQQASSVDTTGIYNTAVRDTALANGAAGFFDPATTLGPYATALANGYMADVTHPNQAGWGLVYQTWRSWIGLDAWPSIKTLNSPNLWLGDFGIWTSGTTVTITTAATTYVLPGVTLDTGGGFAGTIVCSREVLDQSVRTTPSRYGMNVTKTAASGADGVLKFQIGAARKIAGRQVTVSFWAKSSTSDNPSLSLNRYNGNTNDLSGIGNYGLGLTTTWKRYFVTFSAPPLVSSEANGTTAFVGLYLPNATAYNFDIADFEVVYGAVPSSVPAAPWSDTLTVDFTSITAGSTYSQNLTMVGLLPGMKLTVIRPPGLSQAVRMDAACLSINVAAIYANNTSTSAVAPGSLSYGVVAGY